MAEINTGRLVRILGILAFVHGAHIIAFWPFVPGASAGAERWRNEVIAVHAVLLALIVGLAIWWLVRRRPVDRDRVPPTVPAWLPEAAGFVFLLAGAALSIADQREAPSINALMIGVIGVGLSVLTRPAVALVQYALTLGLFLLGVGWTQPDPEMLLSMRVNSLTATGLGFGLSLLQWHNMRVTLQQQRRIAEQQARLEEQNRQLTVLATTDALTGLVNRLEFGRIAERVIAGGASNGPAGERGPDGLPACLIMVDIDNFKEVNDRHGHVAGDRVLVELARVMTDLLPAGDVVGRYGGEEFIMLLPGRDVEAGVRVAERLREAIRAYPFTLGDGPIHVTASFGVAGFDAGFGAGIEAGGGDVLAQALIAADRALYEAKRAGRDCVRHVTVAAAGVSTRSG